MEAPAALYSGLDRVVHDLAALARCPPWLLRSLTRRAERTAKRSLALAPLSSEALAALRDEVAPRFRRRTDPDTSRIIEALAIAAELVFRARGLRPRHVQLMGALALFDGYLVEMATGEGKSLTACLAGALFGWSGRPCHVLTTNDYLAARDAFEWHAYYAACGLTVASVTGAKQRAERRAAYEAHVVYTTATELLADFLRDRIQLGGLSDADRRLVWRLARDPVAAGEGLVLRGIDTVLVDEADSVLIDEAVTPLLISMPSDNQPLIDAAKRAEEIARTLAPGVDYRRDARMREVLLAKSGLAKIDAAAAALKGVWQSEHRRHELVTQALVAREFHLRGQQYVVQDGKVVIVDDFTGRLMPDRSWSHGLHQAVEALEGVEVTSPVETLARMSFQRFFRLFRRVCGMTGTAREVARELWHIYELPVVAIPTNTPPRRVTLPDRASCDDAEKLAAITGDVAALHATGRPVLVGTRRVSDSERLAERFTARGLPFNLLNAVHHAQEARVVELAGQPGAITIATNMAGRGTDIRLGSGVAASGGLHVIVAEQNESTRIDRQLVGRCARQGDPGTCRTYLSPDDELMQRFLAPAARGALKRTLAAGIPGCTRLTAAAMARAQGRAQAQAYGQRVNVLLMDEWLEEALSFAGRQDL